MSCFRVFGRSGEVGMLRLQGGQVECLWDGLLIKPDATSAGPLPRLLRGPDLTRRSPVVKLLPPPTRPSPATGVYPGEVTRSRRCPARRPGTGSGSCAAGRTSP